MSEMLIRMDENLTQVKRDVEEIKKEQRLNYVSKESFGYHEERIKKIEESIVWIVRIVISFVVLAVLGLVVISQ